MLLHSGLAMSTWCQQFPEMLPVWRGAPEIVPSEARRTSFSFFIGPAFHAATVSDFCPDSTIAGAVDIFAARKSWFAGSMEESPVSPNAPESTPPLLGADYLTAESLAKQLGFSPRTLARLHVRRLGPPRIVVGRTIFYRRQSVLEWLAQQEQRNQHSRSRGRRR